MRLFRKSRSLALGGKKPATDDLINTVLDKRNSEKLILAFAGPTDSQRAEIIDMRKNGATVSALARTYGVSQASIMRVTGDL